MEGIVGIVVAPIIIFMIFVAPIWLIMHYRSKKQINQGLTQEEYATLQELADRADKMADRIHTLESILDAEAPQWRNKV
ncbi:MAG: envelope stress response membrane protein PspB [Paraglaciecola sp.]|uniref:envelope stress response membrane protein PspB n=1 Tax=Pseudomonadati TaxID=3379134 RepID=UPI00273E1EB6|nr:envelope stress response membrane protein PspB [Paraglaciecola sp.]MDP5030175.1 envelope stress response membrane protein PspB [Paraglaciecola sp.]MDP5130775.1 envelope stress response membrane protein PspB [Paraglaciecola sp.]